MGRTEVDVQGLRCPLCQQVVFGDNKAFSQHVDLRLNVGALERARKTTILTAPASGTHKDIKRPRRHPPHHTSKAWDPCYFYRGEQRRPRAAMCIITLIRCACPIVSAYCHNQIIPGLDGQKVMKMPHSGGMANKNEVVYMHKKYLFRFAFNNNMKECIISATFLLDAVRLSSRGSI